MPPSARRARTGVHFRFRRTHVAARRARPKSSSPATTSPPGSGCWLLSISRRYIRPAPDWLPASPALVEDREKSRARHSDGLSASTSGRDGLAARSRAASYTGVLLAPRASPLPAGRLQLGGRARRSRRGKRRSGGRGWAGWSAHTTAREGARPAGRSAGGRAGRTGRRRAGWRRWCRRQSGRRRRSRTRCGACAQPTMETVGALYPADVPGRRAAAPSTATVDTAAMPTPANPPALRCLLGGRCGFQISDAHLVAVGDPAQLARRGRFDRATHRAAGGAGRAPTT